MKPINSPPDPTTLVAVARNKQLALYMPRARLSLSSKERSAVQTALAQLLLEAAGYAIEGGTDEAG